MRKTLITFLVAFSLGTAGCSRVEPAKPPMPGMGTIHGVRMVIPAEYKFFGVEYEGDDIWARPPKRHAPGPDVPIRSFSIMLHLPDFAPLNDSNRDSWIGRKGRDARRNEWTQVDIQPIDGIGSDPGRWFSDLIDRQKIGQISWRPKHDWYFQKSPNAMYGLINEKKIGPDYSKTSVDNIEIFYDPLRSTTYIVCGAGAGGPKFCHQTFTIPELGILLDANYAKDNLKYWREIQKNTRRIVISFKQNK
ncbi:hypothetical protein [Paraburkholderia sp. BR13444]|uniref:hypothetical protein n=1 Tax=Paraburkholderia TaxID=1822464 RepID=UPI0034CF5E64